MTEFKWRKLRKKWIREAFYWIRLLVAMALIMIAALALGVLIGYAGRRLL